MVGRNYKDMAGGALLIAAGAWIAAYTIGHYQLGTLQRMGPGMFPAGLGCIMAGLGLALFAQALFVPSARPEIRVFAPLFVLLGTAAFAMTIQPFGLIPAILAVTIISSLAELKVRPLSLAGLCLVLVTMAWLVFRVGLNLPVPLFRVPF